MLTSPLLPELAAYWDGRWQHVEGAPQFTVVDPATRSPLAQLPECGAEHTHLAVDAAERALAHPTSIADRDRWLAAIATALLGSRRELAAIITAENGKPLAEADGEVAYAAGFFTDARRHLHRLEPHVVEGEPRAHRWRTHHRTAGVAALITPWNFPVAMLAKKLAGALAAGSPVVVKPSELTPLSCVALFSLLHGLDLPPGAVNLVFGRAVEIGKALCERPEVKVISFTGSTGVGRLLAVQSAPTLKRLSLELGGNAPFVVFEDANLNHVVEHLMSNKFRCAGQTCVCTNRVLVADAVHDAFIARLVPRVQSLKVGPGAEPGVQVGPLIDRRAWDKVQAHVQDALDHGAVAVVGGIAEPPAENAGNFFPPTVLTGVTADMRCSREETFGPIVAVSRFTGEQEAVQRANDTEYGLAAYLFSRDSELLERVAAKLHFGHVGLNTGVGPTPEAPFGGMCQSGLGREGGFEGILEFIELQTTPTPVR